jgi:hypothetical protein
MAEIQPTFTSDRIEAKIDGEEITIWNRVTVEQTHALGHGLHEEHHSILAGDGSTGQAPEYITPEMNERLRDVDVYPAPMEVVDPTRDDVNLK